MNSVPQTAATTFACFFVCFVFYVFIRVVWPCLGSGTLEEILGPHHHLSQVLVQPVTFVYKGEECVNSFTNARIKQRINTPRSGELDFGLSNTMWSYTLH